MVRATKCAIKQISVQEFNTSITIIKYAEEVIAIEKKVVVLIFANILMGAIGGFYWYTIYDAYLEKEFKQEYVQWRENPVTTVDQQIEQIMEEDQIMEIEQVQQIWSQFGPFAIILSTAVSSMICGSVFCCFRKFKNNLVKFEESPNNPGNSV